MSQLPYAGLGWPNGPADNAAILALPSSDLLMLNSEHWHVDETVAAGKRVLWRGVAEIGSRPAEVGYSPDRYVKAATLHLDQHTPAGFIGWNELDLQDERGDHQNDWSGLDSRYALLGVFLEHVVSGLRGKLPPGTDLHFGAWTPDHNALDYVDSWRAAAEACDVVDFHAYDTLEKIRTQYDAYRAAFPGMRLGLTEWHALGDADEERRIVEWLALTMTDDPLFDSAHRFIWEWFNYPDWWSPSYDVVHNAASVALFQNPPVLVPIPDPVPPPEPPMPTYPLGIDVSNNNGGIQWDQVAASGVQFAIAKATESTNFVDRFYAGNMAGMKANTILRGAYHFGRPSMNGAVAEAEFFCNHVEATGLEVGDVLALDLEDPDASGDLSAWTLQWLQHVEARLGFKPLCYTSPAYAAEHGLANRPEIGQFGLWLASWGVPTPPAAPAPWTLVAIHQTGVGSAGSVPGVSGQCDLNRYNGDISTLPLYGKPAAPPVPHEYVVGPGLLAKMAALGDSPASDELFLGLWSEAFGASGIRYVYYHQNGEIAVYPPAA